MDDLDAVVQERIDNDATFQEEIAALSDEEKESKISEKRAELTKVVFTEVSTKAKENETKFNDQKTRAEKAEEELKKVKPPKEEKKEEKKDELSTTELYALMQAQVPQEDVEEVVKAAKILGKTVAEALKDEMVKNLLTKRAATRKTAEATNTRPVRPGSKGKTDAEILDEASKGNIPEKGSKEAEDLFWARRGGKRK